jgi:hypothetical protein
MALVIDPTVGGAASNSFCTVAEAQSYFDSRLPLAGWDNADSQDVLLAMATRLLENFATSIRQLVPATNGIAAYYRTARHWTGSPASTTQKLSWPRIGMFDGNGNVIDPTTIPDALKQAEAEFAGQLGSADRTLDNDVIAQGLRSIRAGSVALTFKDQFVKQVVPDAVLDLLIPGWLTDELIEPANPAFVEVVSRGSHHYGGWW